MIWTDKRFDKKLVLGLIERNCLILTCSTNLCLWTFSLSRILIATGSPFSVFFANRTFAKVPTPMVRPSSYFPTRRFTFGDSAALFALYILQQTKVPLNLGAVIQTAAMFSKPTLELVPWKISYSKFLTHKWQTMVRKRKRKTHELKRETRGYVDALLSSIQSFVLIESYGKIWRKVRQQNTL